MTRESRDGGPGGPAGVERTGSGAAFDAVAAAVGEGVYRLDEEGHFVAVNDVVVDLVGYDRSELVGEPLSLLVDGDAAESIEAALEELRGGENGRVRDVEVSIRTAAGPEVPCELRLAAVEVDGSFDGVAGVVRRAADGGRERRALEGDRTSLESELDETLDRVSDAFFAVDAEGRFTYVNERAGELLDREPESLVGADVADELHGTEDAPFVEDALRTLSTGEPVTFEEFYPPLSKWFRGRLYPSETGVSVNFRDVTEEKRRESALEQYETVVEAVDDGLYAVDEDYRFTFVNDAYCELTGYDRDALIGEHISLVLDEETLEESMALREDLLAGDGEAGSVEVEIERADGERVIVESSYAVVPDEEEFRGTVGVVRDVSERKAFEETLTALHEASRELHAAETSDDVVRVVQGTVTDVLDLSAATMFRYDEGAHEMVPEHRTPGAVDTGQELPRLPVDDSLTGRVFERGEFRAYDDVRETDLVQDPTTEMRAGLFAPIGDERVLVVASTEPGAFDERTERLTEILAGNATAALERQERERELRGSERRYRTLVDNFPHGAVALYDEECRYVAVGGQMYDRIDLSPEDAVGMTVGERLSGEIAEALESMVQRAFEGEPEDDEVAYDGRDFWLQSLPIRDDDGDVSVAMVVTQDVTERKQAEEALEESERRFRTMMEQSPLSTQIFDPDGNAVMVNPAWERLWQASSEEVDEYNVLEDEQLEAKGLMPYLEKGFDGEATQLPPVYYDPEEIGKEGRPRWIEAFVYPVLDEEGDIREVVLVHNDVTESRKRERELEQYETIVETVDDGVYVLDEGRFVFVNEAFAEMVGHDREELIGADVSKVTTGEYGDVIEEEVRRLEEGDVSVGAVETEVVTAGGERVPVEARFSLFPLEEGGYGRVGITRDVSERKERERELRESERRYRTLVDNFPDGSVGLFDSDLRYLIVGGEIYDEIELSAADVVGMPIEERLPGDLWEELEAPLRATFDGEHHQTEVEAEGRVFRVQTLPVHDEGDVIAGMIMSQDVTEHKEYERELEQYQSVVETVEDGVYVVDPENRFILVNDAYCEIVGREREELLGSTSATVIGDETVAKLEEMAEAVAGGDIDDAFLEIEFERPDGETVTLATRFGPYATEDGVGRVGVIRDVTERKERERELERYETAFDTASDVVVTIDGQSTIRDVNPAVADVFGYEPDELVGEPLTTLMPERFRRQHRDGLDRYLETGEARLDWEYTELPGEHRDGHEIPLAISFGEFEYDGERFFTGIVRDVTERKRAERQLEEERDMFAEGPTVVMRWGIGEDWPVEYVSDNVEEVLGYTPAEFESGDLQYTDLLLDEEIGRITREVMENSDETTDRFSHEPYRIETRDGDVRWVKDVTKILRDGSGDITGYLGYLVDITERKERERELAEQRERYRGLVESAPVPIGIYDADGRITFVNDAAADLIGADDPAELVGESAIEFVHPDDRGEAGARMQQVMEEREPAPPRETKLLGVDDEVKYAMVASAPITQEGEPAAQVVMSDVTERKAYERALEESEQRYRTLVEHFPNGAVALYDHDFRIAAIGGDIYAESDASAEGAVGTLIEERVGPELFERLEPALETALEGEVDQLELHVDGRDFWVHTLPIRSDDGEVLSGVVMVQDITDRKEHERTLERFQTIIETVEDGVYTIDAEGHITMVNAAYAEMTGYDREELIGMHGSELVDESVHERARDIEAELAEGEAGTARLVADLKTAGERSVTAEATFALLPGEDEDYERVAVVRDITERIERERELERALDLLHHTEDVADVGGWELDPETMDIFWTEQLFDILGVPYEEEPPLSEALDAVYHPDDRVIVEAAIEEALDAGERFDVEVRFTSRGDDEPRWARIQGIPEVEGGEVVSLRGAFHDITERVERERELERALDLLERTEEIANVGGWVLDPDTQEVFWTEHLFDLQGIPYGEEPPLDEALDIYHQEDRQIVEEAVEAALEDGEPIDIEVRYVPRDEDEVRWFRLMGVPEVEDGEVVSLRGAAQDVTERIEREAELRKRVEQEDVVTEIGTLAIEEPDIDRLFDRATELVSGTLSNDLCKLLELQPDGDTLALRAGTGWDDGLVGEATLGTEDDSIAGRTLQTEEAIVVDDIQAEDPEDRPDLLTAHGGRSGVSVIVGSPSDPWGVLGTYDTDLREFSRQDVNFVQSVANILGIAIERASREEELHTRVEQQQVVTDLGKRALEDIDIDALFDEAVERVAETLDNEYAKVLELQPDGESLLLRSGVGWRDGLVGEGTVGTGDDSQAGHTVRSEEPIVVSDLATESRFSGPELLTSHGVVSGVSTIIGPFEEPWGVLGTHDTERREFSQQDVNFVLSVANILATAIDRRTREREIEEQRNRMAAIVRLSEIVQEVDQAVIRQSAREEIDRMVCEHLVASGEYASSWIGDVNLASERVVPRAVAGVPDDQVEAVTFDAAGEAEGGSPTATAAATGETGIAREGDDTFPAFARERGYRSMAAVPLAFEDVRYGVLTLFSVRGDAFEGYERTILEQLGGTVGHAINAIDRKQALVGDSFTEIELRFPGVVESLDLADSGDDHDIRVEGTVPADEGRVIQYVSVTGIPPDRFREAVAGIPTIEGIRRIGDDGPNSRYEVTYSDPVIISMLSSYGGRIESVRFDVPDLRVTVALPPTADVRQIVGSLRSEFPDLRIDAQRTVTRDQSSPEEYRSSIEEALTERQRTALMTAFFAGYFEWSRESTGEEVAETLGVSPSTFHQHLRAAQRKVLALLFESERAG